MAVRLICAIITEYSELGARSTLQICVIFIESVRALENTAIVVQEIVVTRMAKSGRIFTSRTFRGTLLGETRNICITDWGIIQALVFKENKSRIACQTKSLIQAVCAIQVQLSTSSTLKKGIVGVESGGADFNATIIEEIIIVAGNTEGNICQAGFTF